MPAKIQPTIALVNNVADYCSLTATQLAGLVGSGLTLTAFIQRALDTTAWDIVSFLDKDYTVNQVQELRFKGNGANHVDTYYAMKTVTAFTSFDPLDPSTATVNEGTANISAVDTGNPYRLYRTDSKIFEPARQYYLALTQFADLPYNGWPSAVAQIQVEMVDVLLKESGNSQDILMAKEVESATGRPIKLNSEMMARFHQRLRPYKRFSI